MRIITRWMQDHGLQLEGEKTESVVITRRQIHINQHTAVANNQIQSKQPVRSNDWQETHIVGSTKTAADKAVYASTKFSSDSQYWRTKFRKQHTLMAAMQSIMLYGAKICADLKTRSTRISWFRCKWRCVLCVYCNIPHPLTALFHTLWYW